LYGGKNTVSLDKLRYQLYAKKIVGLALKTDFELSTLPPTSEAASHHSLRAYYACQELMNAKLDPLKFGWQKHLNGRIKPVWMQQDVAPPEVMELIHCGCKKGCSGRCKCRKFNLKCSLLCTTCKGLDCENSNPNDSHVSENEDDNEENAF
jgi:hypothetical protein